MLARAITLIESRAPRHRDKADALLQALLPHTGGSIRVGLTGSPGVGKSSLIEALGQHLVQEQELRLAVLRQHDFPPGKGWTGGVYLAGGGVLTWLEGKSSRRRRVENLVWSWGQEGEGPPAQLRSWGPFAAAVELVLSGDLPVEVSGAERALRADGSEVLQLELTDDGEDARAEASVRLDLAPAAALEG